MLHLSCTYNSAKTVSSSYVLWTIKSISSANDIEPPRAPPPSAPWVHPSIATGTMVLVMSKRLQSTLNILFFYIRTVSIGHSTKATGNVFH